MGKRDKYSFEQALDQQELAVLVAKLNGGSRAKDGLVKLLKVGQRAAL